MRYEVYISMGGQHSDRERSKGMGDESVISILVLPSSTHHTYIHAYTHTYTHTHHTHTVYARTPKHTHTHIYTHTYPHAHPHTHHSPLSHRQVSDIHLKPESPTHRHKPPRPSARGVPCDVIGHRTDVRPDAPSGKGQGRPVLDLHPHQRVSVVRAPDLGAEVEHAWVEPPPPGGAVFEEDVGEGGGDAGLEFVQAEDEAVTVVGWGGVEWGKVG